MKHSNSFPLSSSEENPIYKPLLPRETRRVWIRDGGDSLYFELEVVSLDAGGERTDFLNNNSYLALSYTWGTYDTVAVAVKGGDGQMYPVYVTKSLLVACKYIARRVSINMPWWIDQLSINQVDGSERIRQIETMKDIYEHSTEVVIWLGQPSRSTRAALSHVWGIGQSLRKLARDKEPYEAADGRIVAKYLPIIMGPFNEVNLEQWKHTRELIAGRWFSRLWIIQEGTAHRFLSQKTEVMCGDETILFDDFVRLYRIFANMEVWRSDDPLTNTLLLSGAQKHHTFNEICRFWMSRSMYTFFPLLSILSYVRMFKASDPRDKVIAMAHFATDVRSNTNELELSYDMTAEQLFINVVVWYIREYGDLDFLTYLQLKLAKTIPDWVPDWTAEEYRVSFIFHENQWQARQNLVPLYNACGTENLSGLVIAGDIGNTATIRALTIGGMRLAAVKPWDPGFDDHYHGTWSTMEQIQCPLNKIPLSHVITRTWCLDISSETRGSPALPFKYRGAYLKALRPCTKHDGDCLDKFPGIPGLAPQYTPGLGRDSFMLKPIEGDLQGVFGIGAKGVQEDDEVWVLKGGKMLYLLRPWILPKDTCVRNLDVTGCLNSPHGVTLAAGTTMYQLVGECFVLGLLDGEVFEMVGDHPKRLRPQCLQDMDQTFRNINILHPELLPQDEGSSIDTSQGEYSVGTMQIPNIRLGFVDDASGVENPREGLKVFKEESRYWVPQGNSPEDIGTPAPPLIDGKAFVTYEISPGES